MNLNSIADAENSTSEIWRDKSSDNYKADPSLHELSRQTEETERLKSKRSFGAISERENAATPTTATIDGGGGHLKKLIDRLELLEKALDRYVGAHRDRLEKRLDESKEFTQDFKRELAAIRQEILEGSPQHHNE